MFIDYRRFIAKNITPRYEFGYGLSYTTFNFSHLDITLLSSKVSGLDLSVWPPPRPIVEGGNPSLFTPLVAVQASVENTGSMAASEVVQLYLRIPGNDVPARQLRGFGKPYLQQGQAKTVQFELNRRDLSVWNVEKQDWELRRGEYGIYVGASVLNIKLTGTFTLA